MCKVNEFYGTIKDIIDNRTGCTYNDDWRASYIGTHGHGVVHVSHHRAPGKHYIRFVVDTEGTFEELSYENEDGERIPVYHERTRYITTSCGDITEENDRIIATTHNSTYIFGLDTTEGQ